MRIKKAAQRVSGDGGAAVAVEFAGWLPCFASFGDCGRHPHFSHIDAPPPDSAIRFVRSLSRIRNWMRPAAAPDSATPPADCIAAPGSPSVRPSRFLATSAAPASAPTCASSPRPPGCSSSCGGPAVLCGRPCDSCTPGTFPRKSCCRGAPELLFLTSIPFTFGQRPWVVEIEDVTTLLYPFHKNGQTARTPIRRSPYLRAVKALLESDSCRGIVTHVRSTAEALPRLFQSEIVAAKTAYVPCGTALPAAGQEHAAGGPVNLLFTCSWHQDPESFFVRGGLDVLRCFETLQERYPQVRLTLRTRLPALKPRFRQVLEKCWVRVIDRRLSDDEMEDLMRETHLFLLPAARIHVVSVLRAMAHGQVVIVSDGWGFREYVEHGRNGLVVPGRYGKASWMDDDGMLREDYALLHEPDPTVTRGLIETISRPGRGPRTAAAARPASPAGCGDALHSGKLEPGIERSPGCGHRGGSMKCATTAVSAAVLAYPGTADTAAWLRPDGRQGGVP